MARVTVMYEELVVAIEALDALWAIRVQLEIPLAHIVAARADPADAATARQLRAAAASPPGILGACRFLWDGASVYWDADDPDRTVAIALRDSRYARLVVGVDDPVATAERINRARDGASRPPG